MGLVTAPQLTVSARVLLIAGTCAMAAACADLPKTSLLTPATIDPNSPVAKEVRAAATNRDPYPEFRRIPATPIDVRPTRAWSRSIYDALRLRRQMIVQAAVYPPAPTDTAEFAASQRRQSAAALAPSATAAAALDNPSKNFVAEGRERATPPSPAR